LAVLMGRNSRSPLTFRVVSRIQVKIYTVPELALSQSLSAFSRFGLRTHTSSFEIHTARFEMPADWDEGKIDAIILSVHDAKENSIAWMEESVYLSTEPLHMANLRSIPVHIAHAIDSIAGNATAATVSISSDVLALYVVLTTKASGRFSDNAFVLRPGQRKTVTFTTVEAGDVLDLELLSGSLRVEHLGYYYQA